MARYTLVVLFFIVLATPFVVRWAIGTPLNDRTAAPAGDALKLVIVTPHNQDIRRAFAAAFSDWHRERYGSAVDVVYLTPGGTNDIVRLLNDKYDAQRAGGQPDGSLPAEDQTRADIDMMWGGGDFPFEVELKPRGLLKPVSVPADVLAAAFPTPDLAGIPLYEPPSNDRPGRAPRWVGLALSGFGLIYSPPLFDTLGLPPPTQWEDLADPRLAGLIAGTDPMRSASVAIAYLTVVQRAMVDAEEALFNARPDVKFMPKAERDLDPAYREAIAAGWKTGMGTLQLMAANARYFTDSGSQPCNDVGNGEAAAGVAIDFYARVTEETLGRDRIRYVAPKAASSINADPIAILYGVRGEREVVANRFITYLLSPEAQRLWNIKGGVSPYVPRSLRRLPIVRSVYDDRTNFADDVNPFEDSGGFNTRADWQRLLFSDMRPIWSASWIDARSTLKESYATILAVQDLQVRAELVARLADVPIEMQDVIAQRARRKAIEEGNDLTERDARIWMAKQRIMWAERFRDHYRKVAAQGSDALRTGQEAGQEAGQS